ncbi:hypothetical protein AB1Y20_018032 [Prymnesium parvum]|uniref:NAD-dependent epimerase/dehydratase domain-containing protein n=1 Tax=Prymnesium parvum TaxID=97485 RepID=A0AB34JQL9_PRYPA
MGAGRLFVFGLGYTGLHTCRMAQQRGWHVSGTCRSDARASDLRELHHIDAHAADFARGDALGAAGREALARATHVLVTIPPSPGIPGDPVFRQHGRELVAHSARGGLHWAGYLSTTGVYGDHAGDWVDEGAETRAPAGSTAADRLDAEGQWLSLGEMSDGRLRAHVFRLAGIYGPGRSALDTVARAAVDADLSQPSSTHPVAPNSTSSVGGKYVSRVHVDDIAATLLASMAAPASKREDAIYNVADDEPAARADVMEYAAGILGCRLPNSALVGASGERKRRRKTESKRVYNGKMRQLLPQGGLSFPTYREGLLSIHQGLVRPKGDAGDAGPRRAAKDVK